MLRPLFASFCSLFCVCSMSLAQAEPEVDYQLVEIKRYVDDYLLEIEQDKQALLLKGLAAVKKAAGDDKDAADIYLECYKALHYSDSSKDQKRYREWKSKNQSTLVRATYKQARQIQAQWILLAMQASFGEEAEFNIAAGIQLMRKIFSDEQLMKEQYKLLRAGVFSTPFAKMYGLKLQSNVTTPKSPVDFDTLYRKMIIKEAIEDNNIETIHNAWRDLLVYEKIVYEMDQKNKKDDDDSSNESTSFEAKKLPELKWQYHRDLFKGGEEVDALKAMVQMVKQLKEPELKLKRIKEIQALVTQAMKGDEEEEGSVEITPEFEKTSDSE